MSHEDTLDVKHMWLTSIACTFVLRHTYYSILHVLQRRPVDEPLGRDNLYENSSMRQSNIRGNNDHTSDGPTTAGVHVPR